MEVKMKKFFLIIAVLSIFLVGCEAQKSNVEEVPPADNISQSEETLENIETTQNSEAENIIISEDTNESSDEGTNLEDYTVMKFSDLYETKGNIKNVSTRIKNLNGKKVEIKGYPAVQSPLDESFVYLNNQPYVTCPFCTIGDTTKLEVIPIFMADGSKIKYTENSLTIYGKLEVASKVDSEGYTTQFRVYADNVIEGQDSEANKLVNTYYSELTQKGMIYDIQTLQMSIEYASNPEYMAYYDEKFQNGESSTIDKVSIVKQIAEEYVGYDTLYGNGYNSEFTYLDYVKECPEIVKNVEPKDERLNELNNELVELYNKQIEVLKKYKDICYRIYETQNMTESLAEGFFKELTSLNSDNLELYNEFTNWNNKLRE